MEVRLAHVSPHCSLVSFQYAARRYYISTQSPPKPLEKLDVCIHITITALSYNPVSATVRKPDLLARSQLKDFGKYVAECLPKYIQKVQITAGDELELLIVPEGVLPVLQFLKDHHNAQFANITDITALDVPSREYRFEVSRGSWGANSSLSFLVGIQPPVTSFQFAN